MTKEQAKTKLEIKCTCNWKREDHIHRPDCEISMFEEEWNNVRKAEMKRKINQLLDISKIKRYPLEEWKIR